MKKKFEAAKNWIVANKLVLIQAGAIVLGAGMGIAAAYAIANHDDQELVDEELFLDEEDESEETDEEDDSEIEEEDETEE